MPPTHDSETDSEDPYDDGSSNGEGEDDGSALHGGHTTGETRRGPLNGEQMQITTTKMMDRSDEFKASKMESYSFQRSYSSRSCYLYCFLSFLESSYVYECLPSTGVGCD